MRKFVGADINRLIIKCKVVSKSIMVVLMITTGKILVDKYFQAVVIPILDEWIMVGVP